MHRTPDEVLNRSKKAFSRKEQWRTIYEDCYRYALPQEIFMKVTMRVMCLAKIK